MKPMSDRPDPTNLSRSADPAIIYKADGTQQFVSNTITKDNGWLYAVCWNGTRLKFPPESINMLQLCETETVTRDNSSCKKLTDPELRRQAKRDKPKVPQ